MLNDKTLRGTHFTCFHAGPMEGWAQFRLEPPPPGFAPQCLDGRGFLRALPHRTGTDGFFAARLRRIA